MLLSKKEKTYTKQCCSFQGIAFLECHISSRAVFSRSVKLTHHEIDDRDMSLNKILNCEIMIQ